MKVRKIAGLASVDDAVGRATEMGRPCLFVPGILDMNDIQSIAAVTILERVGKTVAEYDAKIEVPTSKALVMLAAARHCRRLCVGRPRRELLVRRCLLRHRGAVCLCGAPAGRDVAGTPAACFYFGGFYAESLHSGRDGQWHRCDPDRWNRPATAVAVLCRGVRLHADRGGILRRLGVSVGEPDQLGTLKGQDVGKLIVAAGIIVGVVGATLAELTGSDAIRAS
jgi:hypothetical protein